MRLAIIVRGVTFWRALGTLIHFANEFSGIELYVLLQARRQGKEHDTLRPSTINTMAPWAQVVPFIDDTNAVRQLKRIKAEAVLTQDPAHQFPDLMANKQWSVFGISVFIDSLHYAWRVRHGQAKKIAPRKIYFPTHYIRDKFFSIGAFREAELPHATLGSPLFDHDLWIKEEKTETKSVVIIAPPPKLVSWLLKRRLRNLMSQIKENGWKITVKDRVKTPWPRALAGLVDAWQTDESLLPYASLKLIKQATVHICGYSTSVFEARYYNKPTLNLDISLQRHAAGHFIRNFNLNNLYASKTAVTANHKLVGAWETLQKLPPDAFTENYTFLAPNNLPSETDNASLRILRDIQETMS